MSTNISPFPPFKYFDNSLSLFQIIEFHFPYGDHFARLQASARNRENLSALYVEAEKERLKRIYPSYSIWEPGNYDQMGFVCYILRWDRSLQELRRDFLLWKEKVRRHEQYLLEPDEIEIKLPSKMFLHSSDKVYETDFFSNIANGFNNAVYLEELNQSNDPFLNKRETPLQIFPLNSIFKVDAYFDTCKELLEELNIIDKRTGEPLIKTVKNRTAKAYLVSAVISALKKRSEKLLYKNFTEDELLAVFNNFLKTNIKQVKKDGDWYKSALEEAKAFLQSKIR